MTKRLSIKLAVCLFTGLLAGCGKGLLPSKTGNPPQKTNALGLEVVNLYSHSGESNFVDDVTAEQMKSQVIGIQARQNGVVTSLSYSRPLIFDAGSPWLEMATTRSSSYASALHLLRQKGIYSPVLISVSQIQGYLKYHDDLWYSALEVALDQVIPGTNAGRHSLGREILEGLKNQNLVLPSIQGIFADHQTIWNLSGNSVEEYWLQNPFQFKPLSFYENGSLEKIWMSDRLLLKERSNITDDDAAAFNGYYNSQALGAKMLKSLRAVFAKVTNQSDPAIFSSDGVAALINFDRLSYTGPVSTLWPPSSPGILERLGASERAGYDRFGLAQPGMDEIVRMVKAGKISLEPKDHEGFMIYQRYAIEPLLTFAQLPEGKIVQPTLEIQSMWEDVYKAASAKIQETHQKAVGTGSSTVSVPIRTSERLWLEPVPTFYLRQFHAYNYLKSYAESLPADFTSRWNINGVSAVTFFESLARQMLSLYILSSKQMGLKYDSAIANVVNSVGEAQLLSDAAVFLQNLETSPAMSYDQRFMAVQGRPGGPKSENCRGKPATLWVTLGIEAVPVHVSSNYWKEGSDNHDVAIESDMVVLVDHFNEINACISQPLNRAEWRGILSTSSNTEELSKKILAF